MGRIIRIELENFKSYKGPQIIGPFKDFTAIIGPNGAGELFFCHFNCFFFRHFLTWSSGKSNLMDAVSFVLGERSGPLRGGQLRDLVYKQEGEAAASVNKRKCFVKIVYADEDEEERTQEEGKEGKKKSSAKGEIHLMRSISAAANTSEYRVNDRVVTAEEYIQQLKDLEIVVKARTFKNFLVFQGDVDLVATNTPKDLTNMFEIITESDQLKEKYDNLLLEKEKAEENTIFNFQKKKGSFS
eukprot:TRINITY_DN604_c0_g1_i1.p1 TRINITY_DN604_c0_g1~~TRINITY_DN604_c0_g1_i1.p1  ORF type:complete len:257 (-),score=74.38 TRINITY_DN604_c0_g1_i1:549-1274(-)